MKKQTLSFIGILLIITLLVAGCELLGLGGPKADATDGDASAAEGKFDGLMRAALVRLPSEPVVGEKYELLTLSSTVSYSGDSDDFKLTFEGATSGSIKVSGVSLVAYKTLKQNTTIKISGTIEHKDYEMKLKNLTFSFVTLGKNYTDGEIWYYPSDKPDGVRVAHTQLGI